MVIWRRDPVGNDYQKVEKELQPFRLDHSVASVISTNNSILFSMAYPFMAM